MKITNKRILIIGGTGSLGHVLVERLYKGNRIFVLSRDETKQWLMQNKYLNFDINYYLCDIRDYDSLKKAFSFIKPDIVINASAIKQVPTCEMFPFESIKTNILGVQNLIKVSTEDYAPEVVLGVSTDKACKPVNVYGMCKAIGERLYISANENHKTRFLCVRYGNVMESRGSIIPLFKYHAQTDKRYPVTDKEMTRFFMTLEESVQLITAAIAYGVKGDTFIPIVRSGRIRDLAEIFVERYGGRISEIGIRPGEKIHEELVNEEELRRAYRFSKDYLVIKPFVGSATSRPSLVHSRQPDSRLKKVKFSKFTSDMFLLAKNELRKFLDDKNIFERDFKTYKEEEVKF